MQYRDQASRPSLRRPFDLANHPIGSPRRWPLHYHASTNPVPSINHLPSFFRLSGGESRPKCGEQKLNSFEIYANSQFYYWIPCMYQIGKGFFARFSTSTNLQITWNLAFNLFLPWQSFVSTKLVPCLCFSKPNELGCTELAVLATDLVECYSVVNMANVFSLLMRRYIDTFRN